MVGVCLVPTQFEEARLRHDVVAQELAQTTTQRTVDVGMVGCSRLCAHYNRVQEVALVGKRYKTDRERRGTAKTVNNFIFFCFAYVVNTFKSWISHFQSSSSGSTVPGPNSFQPEDSEGNLKSLI